MKRSTTPQLVDLYHLAEQIERDKSASLQALRQRDHELGLACDARDDAGRLMFWLHRLSTRDDGPKRAGEGWLSESTAAFVAASVAAVTGFLGMMTFLLASGRGLVNVFVFLLLFVFLQLILCLFSALVMLGSVRGYTPGVLPLNPGKLVISRMFPDRRYLRECQSAVRLLLLRYGQEFGAVFTLGAVVAFFLVLAFSDFTFVWGSTFNVSDDFVSGFTEFFSTPWSSWLPDAGVPAQVIADSRYHPALTDLSQANIASMRGWWPFLIMAMLSYALVPRLILWLLSRLFYTKLMRQSFTCYPGSESVLARMRSPVVRTQAQEPEEFGHGDEFPVSLDDGLMLLNWAGALDVDELGLFEEVRAVPGANVLAAGLGSLQDDGQSLEGIDRYKPERLLVAVKSWEPPMADLKDFLEKLENIRHCILCLVPLPRRSVTEHDLQEWGHYARELPFDLVDAQALTRL